MEAVDNLSEMAELDAIVKKEAAHEELFEERLRVKWVDPTRLSENREVVKETFQVIHNYLNYLYREENERLQERETQKGVHAIMQLAGEAAKKIDRFTHLFQEKGVVQSVAQIKEYKDLQQFYQTKIVQRFQEVMEREESWKEQWETGQEEENLFDIERKGLKDLEIVRKDIQYELFYMKKEDGGLYYNKNLLRHIRLVGSFDEAVAEITESDPILRMKVVLDKDLQEAAKEILREAAPHIDAFYKEIYPHKNRPHVMLLHAAIMALLLAANPRNSLQNTTGKSSQLYFKDFHSYLRLLLASEEYQTAHASTRELKEPFMAHVISLTHHLCNSFFLHWGNQNELQQLVKKLTNYSQREEDPHSFWNALLKHDQQLRDLLKNYPNGPLLKTLDVIRQESQGELPGFDPLSQDNIPRQLYTFSNSKIHVSVIHLPSPTRQMDLDSVELAEEFIGFARHLESNLEPQKLLIFNLQDRTSHTEHVRARALEEIQKRGEYSPHLFVVTLAKNGDFYFQSGSYLQLTDASTFIKQFEEQIAIGEECGYSLPACLKTKTVSDWIKSSMDLIHTTFFDKKEHLTRKNRLDFIEIFYLLFQRKITEWLEPDILSFTCKDGVDLGAAAAGGFYLFLRLLSSEAPWKEEEKSHLLSLFYAPALLVRERAIDEARLLRVVSALSLIDAEINERRETFLRHFKPFFHHFKLGKGK